MLEESTAPPEWGRPAPPQRRGQRRRGEIVRAAKELIDAQGPNGSDVTIRGISDRAGSSPATIYHYFADIQAVVAAVAAEYMEELILHTAPAFGSCSSAREFLDRLVSLYRGYFADRPGLRELWFDRRANDMVWQVHVHYRNELARRLHAEISRHSDTPGEVRDHAITVALVGSLWELAFSARPDGDDVVVDQIIEVCCDYWQRQFRVPMRGEPASSM